MTYRNEGLVPLIPQLPSALAILLEEYHQEKDDYLTLHRLCVILEFTARFLATVLLAELWQRRHQSGGDFPEPVRRQLLGSSIHTTLRYTHITDRLVKKLVSPLDMIHPAS